GAGRQTKDDAIDLLAGICMHKKVGMSVKRGDVLATMQTSDPTRFAAAEVYYRQALTVGEAAPTSCSHIFDIIT
ncbi:MAG: thymidine phosphorylase, partial [Clostridia bacterium]|nr:thymidine phosphorylase [Clostridia bacterium]